MLDMYSANTTCTILVCHNEQGRIITCWTCTVQIQLVQYQSVTMNKGGSSHAGHVQCKYCSLDSCLPHCKNMASLQVNQFDLAFHFFELLLQCSLSKFSNYTCIHTHTPNLKTPSAQINYITIPPISQVFKIHILLKLLIIIKLKMTTMTSSDQLTIRTYCGYKHQPDSQMPDPN